MVKPHVHHSHPSRCCEDEPAADVLRRLRDNPPERMGGRQLPQGRGRGYSEDAAAFEARVSAWNAAIAREEQRGRKA